MESREPHREEALALGLGRLDQVCATRSRQMALCWGHACSWHSLEQYRALPVWEHPEHRFRPNFMPQNEHGTRVWGLIRVPLICCRRSMQVSRVVLPLSINALLKSRRPFMLVHGVTSSACKALRSLLLMRLVLPRAILMCACKRGARWVSSIYSNTQPRASSRGGPA